MDQTLNEKKPTLVFGISGRMASGKDTVGSWLLDNHMIGHLAAFADGVYAAAELVFGVTRFNKSGRARRLRQMIGSGIWLEPTRIAETVRPQSSVISAAGASSWGTHCEPQRCRVSNWDCGEGLLAVPLKPIRIASTSQGSAPASS